jgi:hypothetical protein
VTDTPRPGQVYRHADPRISPPLLLRINKVNINRAEVTYLRTCRRGAILLSALHASDTTKAGKRRTSGYVLVQDTEEKP